MKNTSVSVVPFQLGETAQPMTPPSPSVVTLLGHGADEGLGAAHGQSGDAEVVALGHQRGLLTGDPADVPRDRPSSRRRFPTRRSTFAATARWATTRAAGTLGQSSALVGERLAELPVVAKRVRHAPRAPTVLFPHREDLGRASGDRLLELSVRVVDREN